MRETRSGLQYSAGRQAVAQGGAAVPLPSARARRQTQAPAPQRRRPAAAPRTDLGESASESRESEEAGRSDNEGPQPLRQRSRPSRANNADEQRRFDAAVQAAVDAQFRELLGNQADQVSFRRIIRVSEWRWQTDRTEMHSLRAQ